MTLLSKKLLRWNCWRFQTWLNKDFIVQRQASSVFWYRSARSSHAWEFHFVPIVRESVHFATFDCKSLSWDEFSTSFLLIISWPWVYSKTCPHSISRQQFMWQHLTPCVSVLLDVLFKFDCKIAPGLVVAQRFFVDGKGSSAASRAAAISGVQSSNRRLYVGGSRRSGSLWIFV